jgi:hypothetical protein
MSAHNINEAMFSGKVSGCHLIEPPDSDGIVDLQGQDGGLLLYRTNSAAAVRLPPATGLPYNLQIYVLNTGSGTITVKDSGGSTIATVTTSIVEFRFNGTAWSEVSASSNAADVDYDDNDTLTTETTVEGVLDELLLTETGTIRVNVPLLTVTQEDGTVLAKQASTTSGWSQLSNKETVLNIPVNATNEAFAFVIGLPHECKGNDAFTVNVIASKSANNDTLTMDAEIYARGKTDDGESFSDDLYAGSAQAISGAGGPRLVSFSASGALSEVLEITTVACILTLGGTNDGDAVYIHDIYLEMTRSKLTS